MSWTRYLFSFKGRIDRAGMWLGALLIVCWMICLASAVLGVGNLLGIPLKSVHFDINDILRAVDPDWLRAGAGLVRDAKAMPAGKLAVALIQMVAILLFTWAYLAIAVKRLHDRNKSGWWTIAFLVVPGLFEQFGGRMGYSPAAQLLGLASSALFIWGCVELFLLAGISGNNRYGADPLSSRRCERAAASAAN